MTRFHLVPQIDKRARFTMQIPEIGVPNTVLPHLAIKRVHGFNNAHYWVRSDSLFGLGSLT